MKLITIAGRSSVQNISSSSCELLSVGCSHSEFPILLHPIFGRCHSQCPALSWVFICSSPNLVCTIYTSLAIFDRPELSTQSVWFLCYSTSFVQKMTGQSFCRVSVIGKNIFEILSLNWILAKVIMICTKRKSVCQGPHTNLPWWA
jgi:hypothetical protein